MKTENAQVLTPSNQVASEDIKKSFELAYLDVKIYWISPAALWNSTTVITLIHNLDLKKIFCWNDIAKKTLIQYESNSVAK